MMTIEQKLALIEAIENCLSSADGLLAYSEDEKLARAELVRAGHYLEMLKESAEELKEMFDDIDERLASIDDYNSEYSEEDDYEEVSDDETETDTSDYLESLEDADDEWKVTCDWCHPKKCDRKRKR